MSAKICLVGLVGRNVEWINRSVLEIRPDVVVLVASKAEDKFPDRTKFPEKEYPYVTYLDYAYYIKDFIKNVYKGINLPSPDVKIVPVEESRDFSGFFTIMRTILSFYLERNYDIHINISSGLLAWQLASYYVAMMMNNSRITVFFYDKELGKKILFPTFTLTRTEQQILNIIAEGHTRPSEILKEYNKQAKKTKKVTPAMISKYLGELKKKGLVISRNREYALTTLGLLLCEKRNIKIKILNHLMDGNQTNQET